jgi:predicted PurR-regulated permease PerM
VVRRFGDSGELSRARTAVAIAGTAAAVTCGVLAVALTAYVVWRSAALLALLYAAAMLAVVLDRPAAALVRKGLGRTWAVALVLTAACAITAATVVVAFGPLVAQARALASAVPEIADRVRTALTERFGGALGGTPLGTSLHEALSRGAGSLAGGVYGAAGGVASAAGALVTVLVMTVLLLANGPRLVRRAIGFFPPARRPWAEGLAHDLSSSLGGYLAGMGTIFLARVLSTGVFLGIERAPFAIPLSLLTGASVLIPYVGSVLRFVTIGSVEWVARGPGAAVTSLVFLAIYDVLENYVFSPLIFRRTLGISALGQLVAVLFLGYHLGVVGAVLAIPLAASAQIVSRALRRPAQNPAPEARGESQGAGAADQGSASGWSDGQAGRRT